MVLIQNPSFCVEFTCSPYAPINRIFWNNHTNSPHNKVKKSLCSFVIKNKQKNKENIDESKEQKAAVMK